MVTNCNSRILDNEGHSNKYQSDFMNDKII